MVGLIFYGVVMEMEAVRWSVLCVMAAAALGAVLGERLVSLQKENGALSGVIGTLGMWAVALLAALSERGWIGVCLGVLLVLPDLVSRYLEHRVNWEQIKQGRGLCMTAVLVLHHFPEGMAAGMSCITGGTGAAALCGAIVLHCIPETMLIQSSMRDSGFEKRVAYGVSVLSGVVTAVGVITGAMITG